MRRCGRRGRTWRRCAPWRPTGRRRWPSSAPTTGGSARRSRGRRIGRARLRSARALEQRAKEADDLKAALDAKVAAVAAAEDQLLRERTACQEAEGRLQQEQSALADARSALEHECVAREAAQRSLEDRNTEFSKLEGELMVLGINSASQELALQEQGEAIRGLEQVVEAGRLALEVERK
jgi:hypothetical protein